MNLSPGRRLGPYEVTALLGEGGMGKVWRAHHTALRRDDALKVLPDAFASDPDRLARFRREAQVLASLNHPNIAHVYGLEQSDGVQALVLELVEGPTLADRIAQGPIPVDEALSIAKQIAEALEAAHDQGIIHRDLKPANIKLRPDGTVKVLDFGLAKALGPPALDDARAREGGPDLTASPTITSPALMSGVGVILGTAAYMAPEQVKGKPADKRADLWAFGCVLYEALTGKRCFGGDDVADTLAFVLTKEPDWGALPANMPPLLANLLRRCLEKDRRKRIGGIDAAIFAIEEAEASAASATEASSVVVVQVPLWRRIAIFSAPALLAGLLIAGGGVWLAMRPAPARVVRTEIPTTLATALNIQGNDRDLAITPDGSRVIYRGNNQLFVRALDQLEPNVVRGLGQARGPFVSPDGQWLGFFDVNVLKRVSMSGGPAVTITVIDSPQPRGATWGRDGTIVYATAVGAAGLYRVPAAGGAPAVLTTPDRERGEADHLWPEFLPDGESILFTILAAPGGLDRAQVAVLDLTTNTYKVLVRGGHDAHYLPSGHLVFGVGGTLSAVRFDLERLEIVGTPVPVLEGVMTTPTGGVDAAVAPDGSMVYVPGTGGAVRRSLVWVDRQGREEPITVPPRNYFALRLSPDGTRVALDIRDQENDIWIWTFARQTLTRLTFNPALDFFPVWTPDGRRIVFGSTDAATTTTVGGSIFSQASDGTGPVERLSMSPGGRFALSFSPDGKNLLITEQTASNDLSLLPMDGKGQPVPLVHTMFVEGPGEISPDGRWLAYQSNESGQEQIYVRPLPDVNAGRWQVSSNGGAKPVWARNGRELFFLDATGALTVVSVQTTPVFSTGSPNKLFDNQYLSAVQARSYDVTPDGKRFLFIKNAAPGDQSTTSASPRIIVVENWIEELKRLVPVP